MVIMKHALIYGVGGQDGSYLADILLGKNYLVYGFYRRSSVDNLARIKHLLEPLHPNLILLEGDLSDTASVRRAITSSNPDEVYQVADQDHVGWSFNTPQYSADITYGGVSRVLEAVRNIRKDAKVYIPVSATMFGNEPPMQNEVTHFNPLSPYACAKVGAYHLCGYYRQAYNMFVSTAILFNHDSERRGGDYFLHKICKSAVEIVLGKRDKLAISNSSALLDIGYAKEYMEAVVKIMQLDRPINMVLASGDSWTVKRICHVALREAGLNETETLRPIDSFLVPDTVFHRPGPKQTLVGDISRAKGLIDFNPKYGLPFLIKSLVKKYHKELTK